MSKSPKITAFLSPPLQTVYKRIRLSVFIAISLILSSAVACTQGAASLIKTGFIVQPSLHHPKCTFFYDAANHPAALGTAASLLYGGRQQHAGDKSQNRESTQAREKQAESGFISVGPCLSHWLSNLIHWRTTF